MKRNFIIGLFGLSAAALLGCPVFSGGGGTTEPCTGAAYAYGCVPCYSSYDCAPGSACSAGYCVGSPTFEGGSEGGGEAGGDCSINGCPSGQTCSVVDGGATCLPSPDGGSDGSADGTSDAPPFTGCTSNAACADAGAGYICLDGKCVSPSNQCTDAQQCPNGEQCVQGACVPGCSASQPCPTGYSCQFPGDASTGGVCTGNPTPCGSGTDMCASGDTCVDQHCVPKCAGGDASCGSGLVCVDHGCIPDQTPVFLCNKDGAQDACATGSICLHHACYIACDALDASACNTKELPVCKEVTTSSGMHFVCGSDTTLGGQCDPMTACSSGKVCIDGYCK